MNSTSRRQFLKGLGATAAAFAGFQTLIKYGPAENLNAAPPPMGGFGPLGVDPLGVLDLPAGFSYTVFPAVGTPMNDGLFVPGRPDGMCALPAPGGKVLLVRNHELSPTDFPIGQYGPDKAALVNVPSSHLYDYGHGDNACMGGTTTVLYNPVTKTVERQAASLLGTVRNCAGGKTPWNTWISCEENVAKHDADYEKDHGYCFEVAPSLDGVSAAPVPLKAMGRFYHEAIAVRPDERIVYLTEDLGDGAFYRFVADAPRQFATGGKLQALKIRNAPNKDLRNWGSPRRNVALNEAMDVEWVTLANVESPADDLRYQASGLGAAVLARGEGIWRGLHGELFWCCTSGGNERRGQIWKYVPSQYEGTAGEDIEPGRLTLFTEPNDQSVMDMPDNITVAPWGDLIVCEDGEEEQHVLGVTPEGGIYKIAHNRASQTEFAGACFSPDGRTLFFNMQGDGRTVAVTGPWPEGAPAKARMFPA